MMMESRDLCLRDFTPRWEYAVIEDSSFLPLLPSPGYGPLPAAERVHKEHSFSSEGTSGRKEAVEE